MTSSPEKTLTDMTLDATNFREFAAFIRPAEDELRWRAIPWLSDLREAVKQAAEQGKPIFLWTMNGNPLGCT